MQNICTLLTYLRELRSGRRGSNGLTEKLLCIYVYIHLYVIWSYINHTHNGLTEELVCVYMYVYIFILYGHIYIIRINVGLTDCFMYVCIYTFICTYIYHTHKGLTEELFYVYMYVCIYMLYVHIYIIRTNVWQKNGFMYICIYTFICTYDDDCFYYFQK